MNYCYKYSDSNFLCKESHELSIVEHVVAVCVNHCYRLFCFFHCHPHLTKTSQNPAKLLTTNFSTANKKFKSSKSNIKTYFPSLSNTKKASLKFSS